MFNNDIDYMELLIGAEGAIDESAIGQSRLLERVLANRAEDHAATPALPARDGGASYRQSRVDSLLWAYRDIGHLYAELNPLGEEYQKEFTRLPEFRDGSYHALTLEEFGLTDADLDEVFFGGKAAGSLPLREIIARFRQTYCSAVGAEFLHIQNRDIREWLMERMESSGNRTSFTAGQRRVFLEDLVKTEEMEGILHRTFIGQKRFSVQGADSLIPALHYLADAAQENGIAEIVLGSSHRGRLSILNLILNLPPEEIFYLFEDTFVPGVPGGSGDVKYHIGYCTRHVNGDGTAVNITLLPNSSHLESVDAIVEGDARALQDRRRDYTGRSVLPVILHGDASFAAQGVVAETFNLGRLDGYATGGTIHVVVNNQIGFTTTSARGHSGLNPTDVAKMMPVPILHANGDDPEAVAHVMKLALEFRQKFGRDVVVDIYCYRRFGHNEGDEPSYTQPRMYELIKNHESAASIYLKKCVAGGIVTTEEIEEMRSAYRAELQAALSAERGDTRAPDAQRALVPESVIETTPTAVEEGILLHIAMKITTVPPGFAMHARLKRIVENAAKKIAPGMAVDWAMAESLAFGSLLGEGVPVRLSGQDSQRGTFSQRHLVWWESEKEDCCYHIPLAHISDGQADLSVCDSPLSEYSVLAFEYGYAMARREALVLWEAQFGDFSNGAQIIIDNYLIAAKSKWNVTNGLVLLLPHGYEGMGPEHSDAKLERFLQLAAEDNMRVCNVTTPAQYFHLLRSQMKMRRRAPLVVMTPKSLLRHPRAVSALGEFSGGGFRRILEDVAPKGVRKLLLCAGKIYYDLTAEIKDVHRETTGIVRVEQFYPFPEKEIREVLEKNTGVSALVWVQEEPRNRGAWTYMRERFERAFPGSRLEYVGRDASASPATGSVKKHNEEQADLVARALGGDEKPAANARLSLAKPPSREGGAAG